MITKTIHLPYVTRDTHQLSPAERLSKLKADAAYHPELVSFIGNHFTKQFNQGEQP